jgi:hypothetical protein
VKFIGIDARMDGGFVNVCRELWRFACERRMRDASVKQRARMRADCVTASRCCMDDAKKRFSVPDYGILRCGNAPALGGAATSEISDMRARHWASRVCNDS